MEYGWQINPVAWAAVPKELVFSRSWRSTGFTEIEAATVPVGESGIYMLCTSPVGVRSETGRRRTSLFSLLLAPIYVGRTNNLRRRFIEHCRQPSPEVRAARACFGPSMLFWFHLRESLETRSDEAALIDCFGPTANRRREAITGVLGTPKSIGVSNG